MRIRILSLFLALCMLGSMLPYPALAAEETELSFVALDVEDVTIIQNTSGYEASVYDEQTGEEIGTYFYYWYYPDFTATAADGTVYQGESGWFEIDGLSYDLICSDDQGPASTWGVGEHEVTAQLGGARDTFTVTILECPVAWISVEPLSMYEGTHGYMDGYWDEERQEWVENTWFCYNTEPQSITVCYKDGTMVTGDRYEIEEQTGSSVNYWDDQTHTAPWGVGEHTATAEFMGVTCSYQVTVQEHPIARIEVEPITLYEGADGAWQGCWDEERQEWVENVWYRYHIHPRLITVHYRDGGVVTCTPDELENGTGYQVIYHDPQSRSDQWGAGVYTVQAEFMGVTCDYQVTIRENPVERIEVEPLTLDEGIDGYLDGHWDEEQEVWVDNSWFCYHADPETVAIYYKDGTSLTGSPYDIAEQTGYHVSYITGQSYEEPWGPGVHTVTASFMGVTCDYQVTVLENPVERIEIAPVTLLEGTYGYWERGWDETLQMEVPDAWYHYITEPDQMTVYFKDGTSISGYLYEIAEQTGDYPFVHDDQDESAPWGPGVHTATAHLLGRTCEFEVIIQENNVERIEAAPVTILEGTGGYWNGYWDSERDEWIQNAWFCYDPLPEQITVYYKDGTSRTGSRFDMQQLEGGVVTSCDDQDYDAQWGVGTHTARAQFMGRTCTYQVTIQENDVTGIEVAPLTLYEGISGYQQDGWFQYRTYPQNITLYYKDGTTRTCAVSDIEAEMDTELTVSDSQSASAPWGVGSYTAIARFLGRSCEFRVDVRENPIASVSLIGMPEKTVYRVGERIDLKGAVIRVAFTNGTWEDVRIEHSTASMMSQDLRYRITKLDLDTTLLLSERVVYTPGSHTISLEFAGQTCDLTVEVRESTITDIAIHSPDGRKLQLTASHADGTTEQFDVLWLEDGLGDGTADYQMTGGEIATDRGAFYGEFFRLRDGGLYLEAELGAGGAMLRSNTLYGCDWLGGWERMGDYVDLLSSKNEIGSSFTGQPNAENIDSLVEVVRYFYREGRSTWYYTNDIQLTGTRSGLTYTYAGADIRRALEALFGITDADLSLSDRYDPATDTYTTEEEGWGGGWMDIPPAFEETDGLLQVTVTQENGVKVRMLLDDGWRIMAYYIYNEAHDHDYENGRCTECGEKEKTVYTVTYTTASISLAGDIGVNYYAQLSANIVNDPGAYMQFTVADRTTVIPLREAEISSIDPSGLATYRFTCKVAAKQMTEAITGQMYLGDGTAVGDPKVYSVKAYCDAAIPTYSQYAAYAELVDLMEAMLNYGGRSQTHFGYNTGDLANTGMDTALPELTAADLEPYAHGAEGAESGIVVSNVSLLLESTTTIRFYFRLDGTRPIDDYTFYVDGVKTTPVESNGQYYVDKVNVAAKDLDEMVTVTVGGLTARYCGLSYVRQLAVLYPHYYSEALVNVAKALYAYNQAANAYFGA